MAVLDTSYHRRRHAEQMKDPEYARAYELARQQIEQVDSIMQQLDGLRTAAGMSKARLARVIGKDPAAVRRLFTAEVNPELKTVAAMAAALDAEVRIVPRKHRRRKSAREPAGVR